MTTQAQGNHSEMAMKPDVSFESSGLSPEEADRLAASFKPSWEFDEAPFTHASALPHSDLESLEAGGVNSDIRSYAPDSQRSQNVAAHAPPQRVETNEPEVSVIIDRSITSAEMARSQVLTAPPAAVQSPFAAQMAAAAVAPNRTVAPVARSRMNADESLELPASLKKSNKGLFIGLGAAVAAAVLVFAVRAMTSSASDEPAQEAPTVTATTDTAHAVTPAPSPIPTVIAAAPTSAPIPPPPPVPTAAPATVSVSSLPPVHASPPPAPKAAPKPAPAPHHPAPPRSAPKQPTGGGIVRDNPF